MLPTQFLQAYNETPGQIITVLIEEYYSFYILGELYSFHWSLLQTILSTREKRLIKRLIA